MDYEALYVSYYKQVFSFAMTLAKDCDRAEEITQETFTRALSKGAFRKDCKELTWLCTIAKNLFIDEERKRKHIDDIPEEQKSEIQSEINVERSVVDSDTSYRIHLILHAMEEPYKEVFQLRVFGEMSFEKIATIFGKTESWARVTYHRAKLKIQERMNEDEL
ncbi:MAG: sigma-70 family RNA polymerase sigma factor [Lachnospiraceae bacterium]|nr:sigma-70 family RNA polymerase sigma factor [Candidatus Colinaster equi]